MLSSINIRGDMNRLITWARSCFLLTLLLLTVCSHALEKSEVSYFQTDLRYNYRTELLNLALSYSQTEEATIDLIPRPDIPTARAGNLMAQNKIRGVLSLATSIKREEELLAVKIPIMAGILGMRVFLIHKDLQIELSKVTNFSQFKKYVAGFGEHWGDLSILRDNGLSVIPVAKYESLFGMLNAKRFDFFPRGVNEVLVEHSERKDTLSNLAVEQSLAIYYPYPVYFFVNKHDYDLAGRIQYGLDQALKDGRFKSLFLYHHKDLLSQLNFSDRRVFNFKNNTLPSDAKITNKNWWMSQKKAGSSDPAE